MAEAATMERPQRWDRPFGPEMSEEELEKVLRLSTFSQIDESKFPESGSLRDLIRHDGCIRRFQRGDFVIRQGDYGHSVFFIIEGRAQVIYDNAEGKMVGNGSAKAQKSFFRSLSQIWRNARVPEARDIATYRADDNTSLRTSNSSEAPRVYVKDMDRYLSENQSFALSEGAVFGEIAALARTPRTASVLADSDLEVFEFRWQGIRDVRKRDPGIREMLDQQYRERRLETQLRDAPIFAHLDDDRIRKLVDNTLFEAHGTRDWFLEYKRIEERNSEEVLASEPVIAEEGQYLDGLLLICSGHVRLTQKQDHGERTVGYLRPNEIYGLEEIVGYWRGERDLRADQSLRAIGFVDVLRIPTTLIEEYVLPVTDPEALPKSQEDKENDAKRSSSAADPLLE